MWIRALISIKMDRPINPDSHYISPGGYAVKTKNKLVDFDFEDYQGTIDANDPSILHCELKNFYSDNGGCDNKDFVFKILPYVTSIVDCFVYTGEPGKDPEINVEKLLSFTLISEYDDGFKAKSTEWLDIRIYPDEMQFKFTDKAIADYNDGLSRSR